MESSVERKAAEGGPGEGSEGPLQVYNRTLDRIWAFIVHRTGLEKWALRPQPEFSFRPAYWTGAFVASAFFLQIATGLLLLVYYVPSASPATSGAAPQAWATTSYTIHDVPLGQLILSAHLYGAYATIFLGFIHFFRGLYAGAYKPPRELSWMVGTFLLVAMLGMGFTGYLLPYTALSVGATDVGLALASSVPSVGPLLVNLLQGDGTYQGLLSRMFALHVVILPAMLAALLYAHISLFEVHGIAPPATSDPKAKRVLTPADDRKMTPWFPRVFLYMVKWGLIYVGVLLFVAAAWPSTLAAYFGSQNQAGASPEPDWYFLWMYKLADFQYVSPLVAVGTVTALVLFVLFLPWIEQVLGVVHPGLKVGRTHPRDRPFLLFTGNFLLSLFALLTVWGGVMPGVVVPVAMYGAYLGGLALFNAAVIALFYSRYRRRYLFRVRFALPRVARLADPGHGEQGSGTKPAQAPLPARGVSFRRMCFGAVLTAALLVPLGYLLTLPSLTGRVVEQHFAVGMGVLVLGVAALLHLLEGAYAPARVLRPRPVSG
ncbi:MAG: cytochrome bc complex cytochrome b subunit [Euryarchaeota archaeon]|nr:cytochrome bc complex cytochrome b subunit [Euryarchaeota archaeon]